MSLCYSGRIALGANGGSRTVPNDAALLLAALHQRHDHEPPPIPSEPRPPVSLEEAYRTCVAITREHSRSFFFSSQLLPAEKRRAIRALYAFCRTSDDLVDRPQGDARLSLAAWVRDVHAERPPQNDPVLLAWHDTALRYAVSVDLVNELLAGVAMDLTYDRYQTFDDLWLYCYRVASVVGLLSMAIIGHDDGAEPYAITLGVALQLTNILRDVGEDAARGRIYLPQEDLARFELTDADILSGQRDERFRALMRYQIERAHTLYAEAWPGIALLSSDSRFAIGAAADIYRGILTKIEANDYDVFARRAHVPTLQKLAMLPRIRRKVKLLERAVG